MRSSNYVVILLSFDHVTLAVHTTKMVLVSDTDCYAFGNNSGTVLEVLEEDEDFERDLSDTANKASIS